MTALRTRSFRNSLAVIMLFALMPDVTLGQLRIVSYNTAGGPRPGLDVVLVAIGEESVNGIARPIDVLALQEQDSYLTTTTQITNLLNGIYGTGTYARAMIDGLTLGAGRPGLIYRPGAVQLIEQLSFGVVSTSHQARQTLRYRLRPVGYDASADFYLYVHHYKAGTSSSDLQRRTVEAQAARDNADALGEGRYIIYSGDFNLRSSWEESYQVLLGPGPGRAFDPINRPGTWHYSIIFLDIHTQSPVAGSGSGGLVGGGMDDRFDFQIVSEKLLNGRGLSVIPGSYRAFGNNGTHQLKGWISSGTGAAPHVLAALETASDHLPVVVDYQVPARMGVAIADGPPPVIQGAALAIDVTVTNTADVSVPIGADQLDYTVTGSGSADGAVSGSAMPLAPGNTHSIQLDTAEPGWHLADLEVTGTSEAVADGTFEADVPYSVLAHANGSFSVNTTQKWLGIDFGTLPVDAGLQTQHFEVFNLVGPEGPQLTARLKRDGLTIAGDDGSFFPFLPAFSHLPAGAGVEGTVYFYNTEPGAYTAVVTIELSDEDLPGAMPRDDLTIHLSAKIVNHDIIAADFDGDGDVDMADFGHLQACLTEDEAGPTAPECVNARLAGGDGVGEEDVQVFLLCMSGAGVPADPQCGE